MTVAQLIEALKALPQDAKLPLVEVHSYVIGPPGVVARVDEGAFTNAWRGLKIIIPAEGESVWRDLQAAGRR